MDIRLNNATGKKLYYKILDYEGPFMNFAEDRLPGMYPDGQSDFTMSDEYYSGNNTKVGPSRHTIWSRFPKFSHPKTYMSNFGDGQLPSSRSYRELEHNYPVTRNNGHVVSGNLEGYIDPGLVRDIMLRDSNCNIYLCTVGKPIFKRNGNIAGRNYDDDSILGSYFVDSKQSLQPNDPRIYQYEAIIKPARIRETNVVACLRYQNFNFMYDENGQRFVSQYPQDCTFIGLIRSRGNPEMVGHLNLAEPYPYANIDTLPNPHGTYIDSLRGQALARQANYLSKHPNPTAYNYSDDYDRPILGYFDRRWLYKNNYMK